MNYSSSSFSTKTSKYTLRNKNILFKTNPVPGHQPQNSISSRSEHRRYLKKSKRIQYNYDLRLLLQKQNTHSTCGLKAQVFSSQIPHRWEKLEKKKYFTPDLALVQ